MDAAAFRELRRTLAEQVKIGIDYGTGQEVDTMDSLEQIVDLLYEKVGWNALGILEAIVAGVDNNPDYTYHYHQ